MSSPVTWAAFGSSAAARAVIVDFPAPGMPVTITHPSSSALTPGCLQRATSAATGFFVCGAGAVEQGEGAPRDGDDVGYRFRRQRGARVRHHRFDDERLAVAGR